MKISIVTISFNQKEFLKDCIESILSQPDKIELIIVDPGSTDGSRDLIDSYGDRVIKVYEPDQGPADGLNKGFSVASGNILGFINSDDALVENASKKIIKAFKKGKVDAICGTGYFIDQNGIIIGQAAGSYFTTFLYAINAVTVFQQSTFFTKEAFDLAGGFNPNNKTCWDSELFFNMASKGIKFQPVWDKIGKFRLHTDSISVSGKFENQRKNDLLRIKKNYSHPIYKFLENFNPLIKLIFDPLYFFRKGTLKRDPFKGLKNNEL